MLEFAILVLGIVAGLVLARSRASEGDARAAAPPPDQTRRALTPADTMSLGDETREMGSLAAARFMELPADVLRDAMTQHGAAAAGVWRFHDDVLVPGITVGDKTVLGALGPSLEPMLVWSAAERLVHTGPDGDAPRAVVAALGHLGERLTGAMALVFRTPITADRADLKAWVARHAERFELVAELVRTHEELARTNRRTRLLLRETQSWDVEEHPDDLGARLCAMIEDLTGADGAALVRWDREAQEGFVAVADGTCARYAGSVVEDDSLAGTACREKVPQLWHEVSGRGEGAEALFSRALPTQTGCVLVQPLRRRSAVIGAVVATHTEPGRLGAAELRALSLFDAVASFRLASAWKIEEVTRRALVDGLTGLANRVGFETEMRGALAEQMRHRWPVSLVLVDIDNFKFVNDTYGHEAGDEVLRAVARTLQDGARTTDVCARVGGDEMAIVLKDTEAGGARELAERLRVAVESLRIPGADGDISVTASFGVVTYPTDESDWSALYRTADRALYRAKAQGRNMVGSAPGEL